MCGKSMEAIRMVVRSAVILTISMYAVVPRAWGEPTAFLPRKHTENHGLFLRTSGVVRGEMVRGKEGRAVASELPTGLDPIQTSLKEVFGANMSENIEEHASQKSPKKAFLFSAIVPGAGEIYGGKLFKGAVFMAAEAALWTGYMLSNKKGGELEDDYKAFADQYWNVEPYLVWKEGYIATTGDTMRFTHALPRDRDGNVRKTQDYYEMIGKYDQFSSGWEDYPEDVPLDSVGYSELRLDYMDQREDSNRYLKRAGYIAGAIFFNHIVSAIDAAKQVSRSGGEARQERRVKVRMAVWEEKGEPFPALVVSKRF